MTWSHLLALVRPGDTVWMPVSQPQWPARIAELLVQRPGCLVVVLSSVPEDAEGLRALDAGARGYCHLQAVPELLREVEQVVVHGGLWVGPSLVQRLVAATRPAFAAGDGGRPRPFKRPSRTVTPSTRWLAALNAQS